MCLWLQEKIIWDNPLIPTCVLWSKCISRANPTSVLASFYFIDLNHVSASCSSSFLFFSSTHHAIHAYFRLHPFFLMRAIEMHLLRGRFCSGVRSVEWITEADRASLCISSTANSKSKCDPEAPSSGCNLSLNNVSYLVT